MILVYNDDLIQTFSSYTSNYPFNITILAGRKVCSYNLFYSTLIYSLAKQISKSCIAISYQIFWSIMFKKQVSYLLKSPFSSWIFSYIEMDYLSSMMFYYN